MAATVATIAVSLYASVGDSDPIELGKVSLPLHARLRPDNGGVTITATDTRKALRQALRAAARAL